MSRIRQINPESATGKAKDLLDAVKNKLGLVPNMTRAMANSPAVLDGYLSLSGALSQGGLSAKLREQIALTVGEANSCDYCLAAHSAIGKMVGLTAEQIMDSRRGTAVDPKADALVKFARRVVEERGRVSDLDLADARLAGLDDAALAEIVANVALNIFTNYFNHVAETDIDFPKVQAIVDHHEACAAIPGCDETR
ncbi:MAG: carboxymuconolactone decarboxylase family protein [Planctomycetota bacterium]